MKQQLHNVEDLVKSEVNIKEIEYITDTDGLVNKTVKPNFKKLGGRLGGNMKAAAAILTTDAGEIASWRKMVKSPFR